MGIDFFRIEEIKLLRNLVFNDVINLNNVFRKIRRLILFNNNFLFEIFLDELIYVSFEYFVIDVMD